MVQIITSKDFKLMPWKNGGGTTNEIFCLKNSNGNILFRLSMANVSIDGDFSIFPEIDRILFLVHGHGMNLNFSSKDPLCLNQIHSPIHFPGEEKIYSSLINGECLDFNIMTNRHYGNAKLEIKKLTRDDIVHPKQTQLYLFDPIELELVILNQNESFKIQKNEQIYYLINLQTKSE